MVALRSACSPIVAGQEVADADEVRDERRAGLLVDLPRRGKLHDSARIHHRDAVGHRQRLLLIVRHVDERDADLAVHSLELELHLLPELEVEGSQGLVQEQDRRLVDEGPRESDPLLLSARQLVGPPAIEAAQPHLLERLPDGAPDVGGGKCLDPEPEGHVVEHGQVRKERVALEDGVDVPPVRGHAIDALPPDRHRPGGLRLEPRHDPEGRGLAAAARAEESDELAALDVEGYRGECHDLAELLGDLAQLEVWSRSLAGASRGRRDVRSRQYTATAGRPWEPRRWAPAASRLYRQARRETRQCTRSAELAWRLLIGSPVSRSLRPAFRAPDWRACPREPRDLPDGRRRPRHSRASPT